MNYDSRSTWDSGLDAGSIPARSIFKNQRNNTVEGIRDRRKLSYIDR